MQNMAGEMDRTPGGSIVCLTLAVALLGLIGNILPRFSSASAANLTASVTPAAGATPTDIWTALQRVTPIPYTTPLPPPKHTPLDGLYAKYDPSWPQWWACRRCADYRPSGGVWRLQFDRGVMRIFYEVTAWRSLASFRLDGDRLYLFNDPYCPYDVGEYRWNLNGDALALQVVRDACSINLRGQNLSEGPWLSCAPPDQTAAGAAPLPRGCAPNPPPPVPTTPADSRRTVVVHAGDVRRFAVRPDVLARANTGDQAPPAGIRVLESSDSIAFGVHRVLWTDGDWIQAGSAERFAAMGVQFMGDHMGWARVLFDGREVWRGDTSLIGTSQGRYGGYVEVSGFGPGRHTIRVERLGVDSRPVVVMLFGFSREGGVSPK